MYKISKSQLLILTDFVSTTWFLSFLVKADWKKNNAGLDFEVLNKLPVSCIKCLKAKQFRDGSDSTTCNKTKLKYYVHKI